MVAHRRNRPLTDFSTSCGVQCPGELGGQSVADSRNGMAFGFHFMIGGPRMLSQVSYNQLAKSEERFQSKYLGF